ncbi:MAG: hypothetical protein GTN80_06425 [Nitrososphaeria archaeon]|nr:hypothetical protein [Nitrososphaeria archaeon]NIQ33262.1 hypothetical protein [Nitrososphaeria archaeon]
MTVEPLPPEVTWLLTEGFFGYVGTVGRDKRPHVTPVIFVYDGRNVFFVTSRVAKKLKNIRENEKIAFLIDVRDPSNLYNNRAVLIQGRAKIYGLFDAAFHLLHLFKIRSLFNEKYPKYMRAYDIEKENLPLAWQKTIFISRILVEVIQEKIIYWREARPIQLPV